MPFKLKDCESLENVILGATDLNRCLSRPEIKAHLESCERCALFAGDLAAVKEKLDSARTGPPGEETLEKTVAACRALMSASTRKSLLLRLSLTVLFSLPFVVAVNTAAGWLVYSALATYISPVAAYYFLLLWTSFTSLGLSITYGALPLLSLIPVRSRVLPLWILLSSLGISVAHGALPFVSLIPIQFRLVQTGG